MKTEKSVAMQYLEEKQANTMKRFHENYTESATAPAEVGPLLDLIGTYWDLAYAEGVQRRERDTKTGEAQRTWSAIEAGIATLARQLAEAKDTARSYIEGAKLDALTRADMQKENRLLQSQLAEATRRLGEVEGVAASWQQDAREASNADEGNTYRQCARELEAALTKGATK